LGADKDHPENVEQYRVNLDFLVSGIQLVSVRGMKCRIAEHLRRRKQRLEILVDWGETGVSSRRHCRPASARSRLRSSGKAARAMEPAAKRTENRTPLKVTVDLSSLDVRTPAQEGVTENISPRGARVLTNKPWKPNERLNLRSLLGNFRSRARVVYCVKVDNDQFAVGLQLFAAAGKWRLPN
jgi:hypothetical protein